MNVVKDTSGLRSQIDAWRSNKQTVALVPTMGNLHAGHLSLVQAAREYADRVVATIYVNPTQFIEGEDFEDYPRTLEDDLRALEEQGCDLVFTPDDRSIYPYGMENAIRLTAPADLANDLCGASRPGHFDGVVTVVSRLFTLVRPDVAVFGEKDYQQLLIIRRMTEELFLTPRIESEATVREVDGLAMSSRNRYLSEEQRKKAVGLSRTLKQLCEKITQGNGQRSELEQWGRETLQEYGLKPDYIAIRDARNLSVPEENLQGYSANNHKGLRVLGAGWMGNTRLIDNFPVV